MGLVPGIHPAFSAFQVVKKASGRDVRASENRFPAVDYRILETAGT
jgi:hypothetical protein